MASNVPNSCGVCEETYNEEQYCPRTLPCSHSICDQCIDKLINIRKKRCPFCRKGFRANSSGQIPMNTYILDFIKYVEELKTNSRPPLTRTERPLRRTMEELQEDNERLTQVYIADSQKEILKMERKLERNSNLGGKFSKMNNEIETEIISYYNMMHLRFEKIRERISTEDQVLTTQINELKSQEIQMRDIDSELKEASGIKDTSPIMQKSDEVKAKMRRLLQNIEDFLVREETIHQQITEVAEKSESTISKFREVLRSTDDREEEIPPLTLGMLEGSINIDVSGDYITVDDLKWTNRPVKKLLEDNKVFASQDVNGKRRYGKITYDPKDDRLSLHHLKEEENLPIGARFVKFNEIMTMVDHSSWLTFLEFGVGGGRGGGGVKGGNEDECSLGKIIIRLIDDSNYSLNFSQLCTGEVGPSYADTVLLGVGNKGCAEERIVFGDYDNKNGSGGKALVHGVDWKKEENREIHKRSEWVRGLLWGTYAIESNASQFVITTKDYGKEDIAGIYGTVENGLDILNKAISHYPNIQDVKICDCGLILSQ